MITNNTSTPMITNSSIILEKLEKELTDEKNKVYRRQGLSAKASTKQKLL